MGSSAFTLIEGTQHEGFYCCSWPYWHGCSVRIWSCLQEGAGEHHLEGLQAGGRGQGVYLGDKGGWGQNFLRQRVQGNRGVQTSSLHPKSCRSLRRRLWKRSADAEASYTECEKETKEICKRVPVKTPVEKEVETCSQTPVEVCEEVERKVPKLVCSEVKH